MVGKIKLSEIKSGEEVKPGAYVVRTRVSEREVEGWRRLGASAHLEC